MNSDGLIMEALKRIEGKVDGVAVDVAALKEWRRTSQCKDHEDRLRKVEWLYRGALVLVGLLMLFKDKLLALWK